MIAELCQSQRCILGVHDYANGRSELTYQVGLRGRVLRLHEEKYKGMNPFSAPFGCCPWDRDNAEPCSSMTTNFTKADFIRNGVKPQGLRRYDQFQGAADRAAHRLVGSPSPRGSAALRRRRGSPADSSLAACLPRGRDLRRPQPQDHQVGGLEATLNALASGVYLTDPRPHHLT